MSSEIQCNSTTQIATAQLRNVNLGLKFWVNLKHHQKLKIPLRAGKIKLSSVSTVNTPKSTEKTNQTPFKPVKITSKTSYEQAYQKPVPAPDSKYTFSSENELEPEKYYLLTSFKEYAKRTGYKTDFNMFFVLKKNSHPIYTSKTQKFISPDLVIFDNDKQKIDFPKESENFGDKDDIISFDFWNRENDGTTTFLGEFAVNHKSLVENCKLDQNILYPITSDNSGIYNGNAIVSTRQIINKPVNFDSEKEIEKKAETPTNLNDSGINSSMSEISDFLKDGKLEIPIKQLADKNKIDDSKAPKLVKNRRQASENKSHPDPTRGAQRIKIISDKLDKWPILATLELSINNLQKQKCNPYKTVKKLRHTTKKHTFIDSKTVIS